MGFRVLTSGSARKHFLYDPNMPVTVEPRILIHWDGVANNKQNATMADGVIWVSAQPLVRYGSLNIGLQIQSLDSGSGVVAVDGSFSPGRLADSIKNDTYGNALVTKESPNFQNIVSGLVSGDVVSSTLVYSLLRITMTVGQPGTVSIIGM